MSPHIQIHWIGVRKDAGRGAVWAWFTEVGKPASPIPKYGYGSWPDYVGCHVLWGSIGKKCHIEEHSLTEEFLTEARVRSNNFKQADPEKIIPRLGRVFDEELSMYLLMLKMKG